MENCGLKVNLNPRDKKCPVTRKCAVGCSKDRHFSVEDKCCCSKSEKAFSTYFIGEPFDSEDISDLELKLKSDYPGYRAKECDQIVELGGTDVLSVSVIRIVDGVLTITDIVGSG